MKKLQPEYEEVVPKGSSKGGPMSPTERHWVRVFFPQQLLDALSIREISPETFESTMREITESFVRVVGESDATAFWLALSDALETVKKEVH